MLQVVLEGLNTAERSMQPLVRVCVVGKAMDHTNSWDKWCAGFTKELIGTDKAITGLLLMLPTGWIMMAEGVHASVTAFLRATTAQKGKLYETAKVIHHAEDISGRCFQAWGAKSGNAARNNYADVDGGLLPAMLGETVIGMLKMGKGVGEMSAPELQKIDHWDSHFPDIPSNERVGQVLEMDEIPTLADFMGIFDSPVDIVMEADRVWPPERAMVY